MVSWVRFPPSPSQCQAESGSREGAAFRRWATDWATARPVNGGGSSRTGEALRSRPSPRASRVARPLPLLGEGRIAARAATTDPRARYPPEIDPESPNARCEFPRLNPLSGCVLGPACPVPVAKARLALGIGVPVRVGEAGKLRSTVLALLRRALDCFSADRGPTPGREGTCYGRSRSAPYR